MFIPAETGWWPNDHYRRSRTPKSWFRNIIVTYYTKFLWTQMNYSVSRFMTFSSFRYCLVNLRHESFWTIRYLLLLTYSTSCVDCRKKEKEKMPPLRAGNTGSYNNKIEVNWNLRTRTTVGENAPIRLFSFESKAVKKFRLPTLIFICGLIQMRPMQLQQENI